MLHDLLSSERARMLWGVFFMVLGGAWVADNYTGYRINVGNLWPLALVVLGALIFLSRERFVPEHDAKPPEAEPSPGQR